MSDGLARMNALPHADAIALLLQCCGSREWAERMAAARPFDSRAELLQRADTIWRDLADADWHEAFRAHPRIGEREALQPAGGTSRWSDREQSQVLQDESAMRDVLTELNRAYEERFGHIFLICATGRSTAEIVDELRRRQRNGADDELRVAAEEQRRITRLRLEQLV